MRELALTIDQFGKIEPPGDLRIFGINSIIQFFISFLFVVAIFISFVYLIWGALDYILAEGEKQRLQQARQKFIMAIVGLIIVFLAFFIVGIFGNIFGVNVLNIP